MDICPERDAPTTGSTGPVDEPSCMANLGYNPARCIRPLWQRTELELLHTRPRAGSKAGRQSGPSQSSSRWEALVVELDLIAFGSSGDAR